MIIDTSRAKKVYEKDLVDSMLVLKKNKLKWLERRNNNHIIRIDEENENETLFIHSTLSNNEDVIIGNEFSLDFIKDPKKVDLTYIFLSQDHKAIVYLYDMKKTLAGQEVILHLIDQWRSSIDEAEYCVKKLEDYELVEIRLGVITENNDTERRKRELKSLLTPPKDIPKLPSFVAAKHSSYTASKIPIIEKLSDFLQGKVTLYGHTYEYDIRNFIDKKHDMYFISGTLNEESYK